MVNVWCKFEQNRTKAIKVIEQNPSMLTEGCKDRMTDMLKTVYPAKTPFCEGYNYFKVAEFFGFFQYERLFLFLGLELLSSPDSGNTWSLQHNPILLTRNRESYMSTHVLLNLLNELGK